MAATIETEPVAVAEVEETVVEPPPPTPAVADAPMPWLLAARGQWRGAVDAANAMGWDRLAEVATAKQLMAVADAARLAGLQRDARRGYGLVRTRHAGTPQAASAVFALGRVALRAGRLGEAATWFERYAQQFPRGLLVEQALGRSLSCRARLSDDPAACAAAKHYLRHDASGPRATLAREMTTRCRPNER